MKQWYDQIELFLCNNSNPARFYGYVNRKIKTRYSIPTLKTADSNIASSDKDKADMLNDVFHKVFTVDNNIKVNLASFSTYQLPPMADIEVAPEDIVKSVNNLKGSLSRTPDNIPAYFLKEIASSILPILAHLFNLTLSTGSIPSQWKKAIITLIYKKGSHDSPSNYRPISLTFVMCRILENIIANKVMDHLLTSNILSEYQFGFIPNRSTCSQLLTTLNHWFTNLDQGINVDIVYTDISKALDTVSHKKLLDVLKSYGILNNVLNWIQTFICNRKQCVCVNNVLSSYLPTSSGVPQGNVLRPILFIVYINHLIKFCHPHHSNCGIYLYADDTKVFSVDSTDLQTSLDSIQSCMNNLQLQLAPEKCKHLPIHQTHDTNNTYVLCNKNISTCSTVCDLGIYISSDLKWHSHISSITAKASARAYQILHSFSSNNVWILLKPYTTYVRPILEYNSVIWSPYLKKDIIKIESVQKQFTRMICKRCNLRFSSYSNRLYMLNLKSLEYRRFEFDMVFLYKMYYNMIDLDFNDYFIKNDNCYNLRRHTHHIRPKTRPHTVPYDNFFIHRAYKIWNNLPESIINATSITQFKCKLKKFNLHQISSLVFTND